MGEPTVLASLADTVLKAAATAGLDVPRLLRIAELEGVALEDPETRIPFRSYGQLWEEVLLLAPERPFGLKVAEGFASASTYGIVGYLSKTAADVEHGYRMAVDYMRLITERGVGHVSREEDGSVRFQFAPSATTGVARHHTESMVAAFIVLARRWSGVPLRPLRVEFRHPEPTSTAAHADLFGCPIVFSAEDNAIVISAEVAAIELQTADAALHRILRRRADDLLSGMPQRSDLLKDVEGIIRENIAEGAPTVAYIARRLGLSSRTLQRRLSGEGVSYAQLLDRFRHDSALKLLDDDRLAIHDVSMLLGFSEPKAFRRAFKRWTGLSPRSHRNMRRMGQLSAAA